MADKDFKINDREKMYKDYLKKFEKCFNYPISESQIKDKVEKMHVSAFELRFLPRLRKLVMINTVKSELTNKYFNIKQKDGRFGNHYFFTPKTASVALLFQKLLINLRHYLTDEKAIEDLMAEILTLMRDYEFYISSIERGTFPEEVELLEFDLANKKRKRDTKIFDQSGTKIKSSKIISNKRLFLSLNKNNPNLTKLFDNLFLIKKDKKYFFPNTPITGSYFMKINEKLDNLSEILNQNLNLGKILEKEALKLLENKSE